jgi:hypothetical protein
MKFIIGKIVPKKQKDFQIPPTTPIYFENISKI